MEATGLTAGIPAIRGGSLAKQPHVSTRESILAESANVEAAGASAITVSREPRRSRSNCFSKVRLAGNTSTTLPGCFTSGIP